MSRAALRLSAFCATVTVLLACPRNGWLSPMENPTGSQPFTGPAHPHASAVYLNPAAMALAGAGQHVYLGGALKLNSIRIERRVLAANSSTLTDGPTIRGTTLAPHAMLAAYTSVGDRGFFGVALHTPFWEQFLANEDDARYHVLSGHMWQSLFSIAGAYRASSRVLFGLGLSLGFSSFRLELARDTALENGTAGPRGLMGDCNGSPCGHENPAASQRIEIDVGTKSLGELFTGKNLALSAGVLVRPYGDWWIGLSYVSPPGVIAKLDIGGNAEVENAPRDGGGTSRGRAEITYQMPQSVHIGVVGPVFTGYNIVGAFRWQNYSRHENLDIRLFGREFETQPDIPEWIPRFRGFRDLYRVQVGLEAAPGVPIRLGGRLRVETGAAASEHTTPLQMYGLSTGLAAAAAFSIGEALVVTAGYDLSWFPTIGGDDNRFDPRDKIACVDSQFAFNSCTDARIGRATPTAAGQYTRFEHSFSLSVRYDRL